MEQLDRGILKKKVLSHFSLWRSIPEILISKRWPITCALKLAPSRVPQLIGCLQSASISLESCIADKNGKELFFSKSSDPTKARSFNRIFWEILYMCVRPRGSWIVIHTPNPRESPRVEYLLAIYPVAHTRASTLLCTFLFFFFYILPRSNTQLVFTQIPSSQRHPPPVVVSML